MTTYIERSCPHCGAVFQSGPEGCREIGEPFRRCDRCLGLFLLDHEYRTEWALMNLFHKLCYWIVRIIRAFLLGMLVPLAYAVFWGKNVTRENFLPIYLTWCGYCCRARGPPRLHDYSRIKRQDGGSRSPRPAYGAWPAGFGLHGLSIIRPAQ